MEKKPITTFLKVMSVIVMIQSVFGVLINGLAVALAPLVGSSTGEPVAPMLMISIVVSLVCLIINFILAILALQHKRLELVYKISIVSLLFAVVFNCVNADNAGNYLSIFASAAIQLLFCYAVFQQNKLDQA